jgi:tRNA (guanine-N7-)-methyltransferase
MIHISSYYNDSVRIAGMRVAKALKQADNTKNISESGLVSSKQRGIHPHLEKSVQRHLQTTWAQPFHTPTLEAFHQLKREGVFTADVPFILDSGCGTGNSTRQLAEKFPQHIVIGADRSRTRLAKSRVSSNLCRHGNLVLIRAELATLWRLLLNDGHLPEKHFLLYPNPWPKPGHLLRRWHAHPVFPQLLSLGGEIEMRCNWEVYALEFARAVSFASGVDVPVKKIQPDTGMTPFERKYMEREQALYAVTVPTKLTQAFRLSRPDNQG